VDVRHQSWRCVAAVSSIEVAWLGEGGDVGWEWVQVRAAVRYVP